MKKQYSDNPWIVQFHIAQEELRRKRRKEAVKYWTLGAMVLCMFIFIALIGYFCTMWGIN